MISEKWIKIANNKISVVYLLVGTEAYFIEETLKRLKRQLSEIGELEVINFDLEEKNVEEVIYESDTLPFFSDKKLVIARNAFFLKATEKGKEKVIHDTSILEQWLQNPSPTAVTVFIAPYEKLDERKKITKAMKQYADIIEVSSLQEHDLRSWILHEVSNLGKVISDEALSFLIEVGGSNLVHLQTELLKIATYLGELAEIDIETVRMLLVRTLEQDVFTLGNAYLTGNKSEAIEIYHDLLKRKEDPLKLNALIASQVRLMIQVSHLKKKGYHAQQIANQLKVHPYRVKLLFDNPGLQNEKKLLTTLNDLATVDVQLKTLNINRDRILEMFLMK
ncbi:DNA polymerase III subunit delta [Psychrobacillus glaciei]|uniref:DNA polymerase III subunit delta n=1 Tax=Psychrobacillus glaciei TaxID=2283160 RepID=A0A5J6STD9_9BACI|nr:DNA polymerase III subunit delta [Psychrobacillus glaciei]QFF99497.1 DNA polymerase III subunit delta [Psychrobacillus glaciei]